MARGRGRPRKMGLSRMDAAIDFMTKTLKFELEPVRGAIEQLLEVYGGDEGWFFIEEYSYRLLIDTILENDEAQDSKAGNLSPEPGENESAAIANVAEEPEEVEEPQEGGGENAEAMIEAEPTTEAGSLYALPLAPMSSPGIAESTTTHLIGFSSNKITTDIGDGSLVPAPVPSTPSTGPSRRRWPCYGWIDSDEEGELDEDDFIYLTSVKEFEPYVPPGCPEPFGYSKDEIGTRTRRKRKTRWDQKPGDP